MPKRKDALIIAAVLVIAGALFAVSRLMPKTNLEEKVAQTTMAPPWTASLRPATSVDCC